METTFYWSSDHSPITLGWHCPFCNIGMLELSKENILLQEYEESKQNHRNMEMESSWVKQSCAGILICNNKACKEKVSFCGIARGDDVEYIENDDQSQVYQEYRDVITPFLVYPSPHFLKISTNYPKTVVEHLKESFDLFWLDKMSCANKLRVVVEDVLNNKKVQKKIINKHNKKVELSTHSRIQRLQTKKIYSEAAKYLLAIKWIGNIGSHSGDFNDDMLNKGFSLIEKALELIYVKKEQDLLKTRDIINKTKGRIYKSA